MINRVADPAELGAEVERLVASILLKPRQAIAMGKGLFYRQIETPIEPAYQDATQTIAANMMAECAVEGVQAFLEKRKPSWRND